ncbi:MAG TPA: hypothetical protein VMR98_03065, partial [Candidatus Polarisedimenticolaceae bacterium]|nr:hypothetical protein [Candidatus Polarisedimenticolaceae bacterium]
QGVRNLAGLGAVVGAVTGALFYVRDMRRRQLKKGDPDVVVTSRGGLTAHAAKHGALGAVVFPAMNAVYQATSGLRKKLKKQFKRR